jgi:hypothetical protein
MLNFNLRARPRLFGLNSYPVLTVNSGPFFRRHVVVVSRSMTTMPTTVPSKSTARLSAYRKPPDNFRFSLFITSFAPYLRSDSATPGCDGISVGHLRSPTRRIPRRLPLLAFSIALGGVALIWILCLGFRPENAKRCWNIWNSFPSMQAIFCMHGVTV